jgi:hypothetical protein
MSRTKVFVSYSHRDREWLERLLVHLAVLERRGLIHVWSDTRIAVGADWQKEIETALSQSQVAVLLVSPVFLASDYIWKEEMPRIMAHREQGMEVLPLIVRPCAWRLEEHLSQLQARPTEGRPLSMESDAQIDLDLATLVYELAARVEKLPGTLAAQEWELAEQHRASPNQRSARDSSSQQDSKRSNAEVNRAAITTVLDGALSQLPQSWTGRYSNYLTLKLTIRKREGRDFQGSIEYLGDETVTSVEGRFEEDSQKIVADLGSEIDHINIREVQLALSFRETGYEEKGTRQIRFDGEYRAMASGNSMYGAWFSENGRLVERFTLTLDD